MMRTSISAALLSSVSFIGLAAAQQAEQVPPIEVNASQQQGVAVPDPQPAPVTSITPEGLSLMGGPAQTSSYQAADAVPSVLVESPDPYGLSPTRNISIRGKSDFHLSKNIEGLPIYGIVGGADLIDLENVQRLDVYRSSIPADKSLSISHATGLIDQRILGPQDKAGVFGRQAFGSDSFYKTFLRVDTGLNKDTGTKAFFSVSAAGADKWTGDGSQERRNFTFGVNQKVGDRLTIDVNGVYDQYQGNLWRALTYAQSLDLKTYGRYAYNTVLTGNPATDASYYGFNKGIYNNYATFAKVDYEVADGHHIVFRPYYWNDNGVQYSTSGTSVQKWNQNNDNLGGVLEYEGHFGKTTDVVTGYWWQSMAPPPPPTDQRLYNVVGGNLSFSKWSTLARVDNFIVNSPFGQVSQTLGSWFITGGVRYMSLGAPQMQYYNAAGLGDISYDAAINSNAPTLWGGEVAARTYDAILPNIGVRKDINDAWSVALSYGRRYGRPDWGPQASNYTSNLTAFKNANITLQKLVDNVKPELADQVDASVRYNYGGVTVVPTLFYSKHNDKQVLITDPTLGLNYYAGTGSSTEYGAELEASYELNRTVSAFLAGTLVSETFDSDTAYLSGGGKLATKGKQIPNAPTHMMKGGVTFHWNEFAFTPIVRYVGERYGDAINTQRVSGFTTVDLTAKYNLGKLGPVTMEASLTVLNLLNKAYISEISPNDTNLSSAATYYVGAPRTIVGSLTARF